MMQVVVNRRRVMVVLAVIVLFVSVTWIGVVQRASAQTATPVVYVATGENFPDALGASAAAAVQGGPVLLVTKTSIPAETKAELGRLSPNVIYVAGGTAVVSDAVVDQLKAYAPTVTRVAGSNRYATAAKVSESAFPVTGGGNTAALEAAVAALTVRLDAVEAENDALKATLSGVYRNGNTLVFEGMNLQVVNGKGVTASSTGLGNVIIGYNEDATKDDVRTGSHYLIIGSEHSYTNYGGIVAGSNNTSSGNYASVTGGANNSASGRYASVTGGNANKAIGDYSWASGGFNNEANGYHASASGGDSNEAMEWYSSVSGGRNNTASGEYSSVSGGYNNTAEPNYSSILGGQGQTLTGWYSHYPS